MRFGAMCILAGVLVGCGADEPQPQPEPPSAPANPDAMCVEHGVLESVCTLCNPALVPVFRARGDFCEEHGLPESICPVCHPEREGRPQRAVAVDRAPADGTRVRLASGELARRVGIRVEEVTLAPHWREVISTARVVYDPRRLARINPRSPGVIRAIHVDIGQRVEPGDDLLTIASAAVGANRTRLAAAQIRLEVAEAELERRTQLELDGAISERDVLESRRGRAEARAEVGALRASLDVVGHTRRSEYMLTAPIAGVVTRRLGTIGAFVESDATLVEIVDASRVWIELDVPEDEIAQVVAGQAVVITMDALGDRIFEGTLDYVAPEIDQHTRTVLARVPLDNQDGALRAHMYGRGRIRVPRAESAVRVPRGAVQRARGATLVFVRIADELYEARRVEVRERPGDSTHVEVLGRVAPGDEVVVDGAFLLRTETVSDSIGAGCCADEPGE